MRATRESDRPSLLVPQDDTPQHSQPDMHGRGSETYVVEGEPREVVMARAEREPDFGREWSQRDSNP